MSGSFMLPNLKKFECIRLRSVTSLSHHDKDSPCKDMPKWSNAVGVLWAGTSCRQAIFKFVNNIEGCVCKHDVWLAAWCSDRIGLLPGEIGGQLLTQYEQRWHTQADYNQRHSHNSCSLACNVITARKET